MSEEPVNARKKLTDMESRYIAFAKALANNYISIAEVDLHTGNAVVLRSTEDSRLEGVELPWQVLLERYAQNRAYPEDRAMLQMLTYDRLKEFFEQGQEEIVLELRCVAVEAKYIWVEIRVSLLSSAEKKLLVTTHSVDGRRMLKSIVEKFVFQNFDYFILLNARNNSYTMFSGDKNGIPLPPMSSDDYTTEVARYNAKYVPKEDYARVTANMQIPHVLEMLEHEPSYSFTSGGFATDGTLRRSRVQYQYYDKAAGLILLTRTNTTEIFKEEQEKNKRLTAALYEARHDALTGLLNQKGTEAFVIESLEQLQGEQGAFLFIDVDNFKMVNDTLGHQEGDRLLRFLGNAIQKIAKPDGIAGRIGGDEFLLYLPRYSSIKIIMEYAQQICGIFDTYKRESCKEIPISCSVGVSIYPKDGTDYECLLRKADQALYTSKRYGKNRCYFYSEELPTTMNKERE